MAQINALMIAKNDAQYINVSRFGNVPIMYDDNPKAFDIMALTDDGATLIIERKTLSDLLNTLADERLFPQLARMKEVENAWCYLCITDPITCDHNGKVIAPRGVTGWTLERVWGALESAQQLGVTVTFCNGQLSYEDCVLRIGRRDRSPEMQIRAPRTAKFLGPKFDFLAGIQGVEIANGQKILDWCENSIAHALVGLVDLDVPAPIPLNTRKRFRNLLGLQEGENLEVIGTKAPEIIMQGEKT